MIKPHSIKNLIMETNMNLFSWTMIEDGFLFSPSVKRFVGDYFSNTVMHVSQDEGQWGVDIKLWNRLGQKIQDRLTKGKLDAHGNLEEHIYHGQIVFKLAHQVIDQDLRRWNDKKYLSWLKQVFKHYVELNGLGCLAVVSDYDHNFFSNRLAGILEKYSTPKNPTQKYLAILISPDQPDLNWAELLRLLEIIKQYKTLNKIVVSKKFKAHAKKYKWLNFGYQGPLWTDEDFIQRVRKILKNEKTAQEQLNEHRNYFRNLEKEQRRIEKDLGLSDHEIYMFDQARTLMFTKAYRLNVRHVIQYALETVFLQLAKKHAVPVYFFRYALRNEILDFVSGKKIDTVEILRRRHRVLKIVSNRKIKFIPANKIDATLGRILEKAIEIKQDYIEGQSAFPGKARGRAKLVFGIPDLQKVTHDYILVAVTTTPDVLPAMGRARGFVTDSGGITSHAAIVAREMKKPCVIGTKFATKLFKDGDMIEVDADKGIVRKV
ncbi:MAG: hypothetical protein A3G89_00095 [Candidatus Doudnabacteria bacterium RIFCSPLOWO2_12_FULL_42_9]|nr:MAG: hypothetical protein A3G89_00095 [Candidatus Doudnabacteria bacterium RIFCSPLOWO2_12_FULL_42_9]